MRRKLWDMFFLVLTVGVPSAFLVGISTRLDKGGVVAATASASVRGDVFGNFIEFAGILIAVMLAILAVVTSMDERPLIKALKKRGDNSYERLVYAMFAPVIVAIVLAIMTIVALAVPPASEDGQTIAALTSWIVSITMGLAAAALAQTGYLALLLVRLLTFKEREPWLTSEDEPKTLLQDDDEPEPQPSKKTTKTNRRRTSHASA